MGDPRTGSQVSDSGRYPPIADYGLISDMHSCALVSRAGSIDWCCFPRFDGAAVFSRILDWERGGYFQLAPEGVCAVRRRYLPATNVLETIFETDSGVARLLDFMPVPAHAAPQPPRGACRRPHPLLPTARAAPSGRSSQ